MDITIETAVVALVALVAAVAVLGIATGQVDGFTNFANDRTSGANCQIIQAQYENDCDKNWEDFDAPDSCDQPDRSCSQSDSTT